MAHEYEKVSLTNIGNGAAIERFDAELARCLGNIADINTEVKAARVITLKVSIVPSSDRSIGAVNISCNSKLAGLEAVETSFELVKEGKSEVAYQRKAKQGKLGLDNVKPFNAEGGK